MARNSAYIEALTAELHRAGIETYELRYGGKHPRIVFTYAGREKFVAFPSSSSDNLRGVRNAVAHLRRMLTLLGLERTNPSASKQKNGRLS